MRNSIPGKGRLPMCWKCCHMEQDRSFSQGPYPDSEEPVIRRFFMSGCSADERIESYEDAQNGCPLWLPLVKELLEKIETMDKKKGGN